MTDNCSTNSVPHMANLLTDILINYPEIATIKLDPKSQVVKFSFYLKTTPQQVNQIENELQQTLQTYYYLEKIKIKSCSFLFRQLEYFTVMEYERDVLSMTKKEINLILALLKEEYGVALIADEDDFQLVDDISLHDELVSFMAEKVKTNIELIALRDEGKVVVYNN